MKKLDTNTDKHANRPVNNKKIKPYIFKKLDPAIPSVAFDTYWKFAVERQNVFFARLSNAPLPWTHDPIISEYKFTNAYRASDRVSQYLIRNVIYTGETDINEVFFRTILFKLFNKIETWQLLESQLSHISWESYDYKHYEKPLAIAMASGAAIYSAAYIMASGHQLFDVHKKHQSHLKLIEKMMRESLPLRLTECKTMLSAFELLKSYPLIGDFLAYQLLTDINYTEITNFSEMDFTIPGPGAKDGIRKCFKSLGGLSETEIIRLMADRQDYEFDRLNLSFKNLWGRQLQLIDIQNLFCEVDKYSRIKHPEIAGISGRTRIKQKFKKKLAQIDYFYPPKWNLNIPKSVNMDLNQINLL